MKSEILKHLRNYRNGSTKLRNLLDIHDKIIKLKTDNRIISQRINDLIDFPKPYGGLGLYIPQLKNSQVNILNKKDANKILKKLKKKQIKNGNKILELRKLLQMVE